jgi:hypothetical protein
MNEPTIRKYVCVEFFDLFINFILFLVSFACNLEYFYIVVSGVTDMGLFKSFMFYIEGILGTVQESYRYQLRIILRFYSFRTGVSQLATFSIRSTFNSYFPNPALSSICRWTHLLSSLRVR